ncbi:hypothetical protein BAE44_0026253 [Dichanthelium oligosanthes]|uniref:Uncharacterized protein n=1 Tax=Dichanthelium oligosanthes TaxID=888268 RepID=A0A1E5UIS5_9POAL|nr:hypothetical protein BAE44_0026253 [Dichanthelium oligosanthes]
MARLTLTTHGVADAWGVRHGIRLTHDDLMGVCDELALAASAMAASQHVALRDHPLLSVHYFAGRERSMRRALGVLRSARGLARDAHGSVERCCGHLPTCLLPCTC